MEIMNKKLYNMHWISYNLAHSSFRFFLLHTYSIDTFSIGFIFWTNSPKSTMIPSFQRCCFLLSSYRYICSFLYFVCLVCFVFFLSNQLFSILCICVALIQTNKTTIKSIQNRTVNRKYKM